jgi:DNA-binding response OmpR family regulator
MKAQILIVEDDANIAKLISIRLANVDYATIWAKDGGEALTVARKSMPDLILLDVTLPVMDGFQVLKKLKTDLATKHIPVIMLTARSDGPSVIAGIDSGAEAYLVKPIHFTDLIRRIQSCLAPDDNS